MKWYLKVVAENYVNFSGRARRTEYWMFVLINLIIAILIGFVDGVIAAVIGFSFLGVIYSLAILLPAIGVSVRRLHDTDRSAWWLLIGLIPFVGWIILLIIAALPGTPGANSYGEDPKRVEA